MGIEPNLRIFQDIMLEIYAKCESTLNVNHFAPKKWCIISIVEHNNLKSWWYPLDILNSRIIIFWNLHDNILKLKVNFERKLILIQQLDEETWIIYIGHFVDGHKVSCLWFMKHYQTKQKTLKMMQFPCINFLLLSYGSGFFL